MRHLKYVFAVAATAAGFAWAAHAGDAHVSGNHDPRNRNDEVINNVLNNYVG